MDNEAEGRILAAITTLTGTVEKYHGDFREFRGATEVRLDSVEADIKSQKFWSTLKAVVVVPVIAIVHQVASHYGLIK